VKTPKHLLLVTDMDCIMAVLVDPDVGAAIYKREDYNDAMLQLINDTDDANVYTSFAEILNQVTMYDLEIVGEGIGAIY